MAIDSTRLKGLPCALPLLCCGWLLTAAVPCDARDPAAVSEEEEPIDLVMFHDPQLKIGDVQLALPDGLKELWLKAIDRGDSELQQLAADSFALAQQRGMKDLEDTHSRLADLLKVPKQDLVVHRAAVHTLVHLDARDYAKLLAETAKVHGLTTSLVVEPALARWKSDIMKDEWLSRIDNPRASLAARILAIDGLGETEEAKAVNSLKRITVNLRLIANERMAAARALSKMRAPGLVSEATTLIGTKSQPALLNTVLALELMQTEDSQDAVALLEGLASHDSTAVQSGALQRLYAIDPKHVYGFAESAIKSKDAGVRTVGARTLIVQKKGKLIAPLATLLDDVNPTLRRHVARAFVQLASEPTLHEEVIKQTTAVLNRDQWRGIEQAVIVLVSLDHKPAGDRFVELMQHSRGEVKSASAWGLRRLALPVHLPAMLARAHELYDGIRSDAIPLTVPGVDLQSTQLFLAFGQMRYMDAEPLLMHYVPKDHTLGVFSRCAAIWSVGLLHEGKAPADLTATLIERLSDVMSMEPEDDRVRRMSAISIGRMKSESAVATIRKFATDDSGYVQRSCYWALEQLTGETPPPLDTFLLKITDWFLVPIR
jgi:hypothetical protein